MLSKICHAQISIQDSLSPQQLLEEYFAGSGISISNISFDGSLKQIGSFKNTSNILQIDSGFMLSTDQIQTVDPIYNGTAQTSFSTQQDLDLKAIANSVPSLIGQNFSVTSVNDVAAISFDFVPSSDSVFFNFVFGTDEYMEWVNTPFNDVFGFLISGPGISGSYSIPAGFTSGSKNIALIQNAGSELPITVSSVNAYTNNSYYINNTSNVGINVDGYTTKLRASANVICGETYHLRLAIADGSDQMLKSAVFFEAGSFSTKQIQGLDSHHVCLGDSVQIEVTPPAGSTIEWFTNDQATGNALETGNILRFVPEFSQTVYAFSNQAGCRSNNAFGVEIIVDSVQKPMGINTDTICAGQNTSVLLETDTSHSIVWYMNNSMTGNAISTQNPWIISPNQSTNYYAFASKNGCYSEPFEVHVEVISIQTNEQIIHPSCYNSNNGEVSLECSGGIQPYDYQWNTSHTTSTIESLSAGNYTVTISDQLGCQESRTFTIQAPEAPSILMNGSTSTCKDSREVFTISAPENAQFLWSTGQTTDSIEYLIDESLLLYVTVTDPLGCIITDSLFIEAKICIEPEMDTIYKTIPQEMQHLFIPNVFTPNLDGQNDVFSIESNYLDGAKLMIYNRWGQLMFESQKNKLQWNGKNQQGNDVPPGNYYYILTSSEFKEKQQSGNITLIR